LTIVLTLVGVDQTADAMLEIVLEVSSVDILIGVSVFAFACSELNDGRVTPS